ncbi:glycosyltransferase family 2 protein [Bacillus changyiensis]|uniref:glycosyltransferase family 2 protein n=1 Tax=Bacillus changyiensis TaxID=3004103 RepID=UPI0022E28E47|nr:glycosyltransferase family 2 protein [Bacillus changyiensis]MDA1476593.1 glycosyltransferase family 2 protein [Bacillus changyiensis]
MSNDKYKLSVVVLVYNTENYLRECLDSLVNQTLKEIEIIIVNDESPDDSHLIIDEYRFYHNVKVINQKNSGGAIAGNNGLHHASGEFVTVMDSDDIVPLNAYEKMYNEAKKTEADIVIGRPNILIDGVQKEILYKKEREVWKENRIIDDIKGFLDIFYDGFYWNKIFKRSLMFEHDCFMPPKMLYADRPMVHKAFLNANRIAIITDLVYLWRKRGEEATQKSITQLNGDLNNFLDRMESIDYQLGYFEEFGDPELTNEFLKRNIERIFFPIQNIAFSKKFRDIYYEKTKEFLLRIEDIYENEIGILNNLYIYLILNDLREELMYFVAANPKGDIIEENNRYFWALPFFRNEELLIPDELFEIKVLKKDFIKIENISVDQNAVHIEHLDLPEIFKDDVTIEISFESRHDTDKKKSFDFIKNDQGLFSVTIPLTCFENESTGLYDIYFIFNYKNKQEKFRISKKNLISYKKSEMSFKEDFKFYFTPKGHLSLKLMNFSVSSIHFEQNQLTLLTNKPLDSGAVFYLKNRLTKEKIFLVQKSSCEYEILWDHFFDEYMTYDFYFVLRKKHYRLSEEKYAGDFGLKVKRGRQMIQLYKTKKNNLSISGS